jgi:hypothetical protein
MNVLLVITTMGGDDDDNTIALIPGYKLHGVPLKEINGKTVNRDDISDSAMDAIVSLYNRLGLERNDLVATDLKEFLRPETPFVVDEVIRIGWDV